MYGKELLSNAVFAYRIGIQAIVHANAAVVTRVEHRVLRPDIRQLFIIAINAARVVLFLLVGDAVVRQGVLHRAHPLVARHLGHTLALGRSIPVERLSAVVIRLFTKLAQLIAVINVGSSRQRKLQRRRKLCLLLCACARRNPVHVVVVYHDRIDCDLRHGRSRVGAFLIIGVALVQVFDNIGLYAPCHFLNEVCRVKVEGRVHIRKIRGKLLHCGNPVFTHDKRGRILGLDISGEVLPPGMCNGGVFVNIVRTVEPEAVDALIEPEARICLHVFPNVFVGVVKVWHYGIIQAIVVKPVFSLSPAILSLFLF